MALNNISFTVEEGEILGFLGPNGAGKTTTMNIMTGYIASTEGEVRIGGIDVVEEPEKAKAQIGYLPEAPPVYGDMRVDEYLNFVAAIKKVKYAERRQMISDVKTMVHIEDMSKRLIKNLSKGYRQRVGLAQAMIGYPKLIIMDEPTVGLDPKQIIEMRDVVKRLGKKHTIILSSHIMQEVSAVCDRVMIINKGRIVASDTPERLSNSLSQGHKMSVRVKGKRDEILAALKDYPIIKDVHAGASREPGTLDLELAGEENMDIREAIFACMAANSLPILMMKSLDLSLEEIFLQVTGGGQAS
ncbi:MAG: ABC transporter ATP-binding protein [Defluviitaleaceae bacterium]|nr:ABC transporter ATP-binding protein [Defluviitaleaceae bacterium]